MTQDNAIAANQLGFRDEHPTTYAELEEIVARYPQPRSALLPMLHLVQSVEGRVTARGIEACADILGISAAARAGIGGRSAGAGSTGLESSPVTAVPSADPGSALISDPLHP